MVFWRRGGTEIAATLHSALIISSRSFPSRICGGMPRLFFPQILICHDIPDGGTCMGFGWGGVARIMRDMLNKKTVGTMND